MKELVKKLRKYQIQIRKAINNQMHGDFHSVFKGSGLEFDDVRAYQYGDDSRTIDWNVTAKGHGTFVKTYKEEKDISVWSIANAGLKGLNKITGADMSLLAARDESGGLSGLRFKSKRFSVASPVERSK